MRAILFFLLFLPSFTTFSQGFLTFANFFSLGDGRFVDAPVRNEAGVLLGAGWYGQIYATPAGNPLTMLQPQFPIREFSNGYIYGPEIDILGSSPAQRYTIVMRAFNGPTYENSLYRGDSNPVDVFLAGGLQPGPALLGLQPFVVTQVPEPHAILIWLLAGGFCLYNASRKCML